MNGTWQHPEEYNDITNLVNFFTKKKLKYWNMSSQNSIATGKRIYALGDAGKQYIVYAATGGTFTIQLPEGGYKASRFNPKSGKDDSLSEVKGGKKAVTFVLPENSDWVVYLQRH